jgi:tryptophan-rich sensory protein
MRGLASPRQLREAFARRALVTVPGVLLLGFLSGQVAGSTASNPWFAALAKPAINPPPLVFPLVWSLLYAMMGLALAMVLAASGARRRGLAVGAFAAQLACNLAWSPVFFGMHRISFALGVIVAIDVLAAATLVLFWRVRRAAGWLLVPYLAWLLFATLLNWQILRLNPDADGRAGAGATVQFEM